MRLGRKPHRMFASAMGKRKWKRIVWDIETWGLDARNFAFACSIAVETGEERTFYSAGEARDYFESQAPCLVYAHNQFGFDAWSLMSKVEAKEAKKIAMGTNIYELTLNRVRYRDTKHLFPMKLSDLGAALGFPKGETPEDYITGKRREITPEDVAYCKQDCRILVRAINDLEASVAEWIGRPVSETVLPLTTASLAYRVWSETSWPEHWGYWKNDRSGGRDWVKGVSCDPYFNQTAKEAYAGGRVQVLCEPGVDQFDIVSYDANSMFPSVQHGYQFPDLRRCMRVGPTAHALDDSIEDPDRVSWANVTLSPTAGAQRFLPNRNDKNRLDWTMGEFSGWLAGPELEYALGDGGWELDSIRELNTAAAINPFKSHVSRFFDLKAEAQRTGDPRRVFYKLILNSGYGRFAMRATPKRVENPEEMEKAFESEDFEERYELRFYDPRTLTLPYLVDRESANRTPGSQWFGFAAWITSGARVELQKAIHAAGEHAKYVDTDSVYMGVEAQEEFERSIPLGDALGEWKQEQEAPIRRAVFWEPKAYTLFGNDGLRAKVRHKGVDIKDRHGNFLENAGDLRKPQISTTTTKLYTSLRRGLEPGVRQVTRKLSKRWHDGS